MMKRLLFGVAGITVAGMAADIWAACVPVKDCDALGYKYAAADCAGKGVVCPFDTTKFYCPSAAESCSYSKIEATCVAECKNVGSRSCMKNGVVYYESCGNSYCSENQTCEDGICVTPLITSYKGPCCDNRSSSPCMNYEICKSELGLMDCYSSEFDNRGNAVCPVGSYPKVNCIAEQVSSSYYYFSVSFFSCSIDCSYSYTEEYCKSLCRKPGKFSCTRNGKTYYESCGESLCGENEICVRQNSIMGRCINVEGTSGKCCNTKFYNYECEQYRLNPTLGKMPDFCYCTGFPDCIGFEQKCYALGGRPFYEDRNSAKTYFRCTF